MRYVCERTGRASPVPVRSYRWRAKRLFGLSSVDEAFPGVVTVIQRFDPALRLNMHMHTLARDGVYVKWGEGGGIRFLRLWAYVTVRPTTS